MEHLAWPLCICGMFLVLGVILLLQHRKEIGRLIDRIKSISKSGVDTIDAGALATTKQEEAKEIAAQPSEADQLLQGFDNQLLVEQENLITTFLNEKHINNPAEREQVLTRYLASAYIVTRFEATYRSIFGSQLRAMEMLNSTVPEGLPFQAVEAWYEVGRAGHPGMYRNGAYTFEHWLGYMHRMVLIKTIDTHLHITVFGREFLKYLLDAGYSTSSDPG